MSECVSYLVAGWYSSYDIQWFWPTEIVSRDIYTNEKFITNQENMSVKFHFLKQGQTIKTTYVKRVVDFLDSCYYYRTENNVLKVYFC